MADLAPLSLNDGKTIPRLGLGVWQVLEESVADVVSTAIGIGYRLIDGARIYGNEAGMGEGIRASGVARDELFVTSKVWNEDQGYDATRRAVEGSLKRIGVEYLDLCLIHWPCPAQDKYVETYRALMDARSDGQIRSAGVSNFQDAHLDRVIKELGEAPALNQIELHPAFQQAQMRAADEERGVLTQSWSPLGRMTMFEAPEIKAIAERIGCTPAQVILRWHLQLGVSVIPRSTNAGRLKENFDTLDITLTEADMAAIAGLDQEDGRIGPNPDEFEGN